MVPLSNFTEKAEASATERAVYFFLRHLEFRFSFGGLKRFKAKYADHWEPRYVMYRHALELPRLGLAMTRITELKQYAKVVLIHNALRTGALMPRLREQERSATESVVAFSKSQTAQ